MSAPPVGDPAGVLDVRLSPRLAVRLMGVLLVAAAAVVLLTVLVIGLLSLPGWLLSVVVVVLAVVVLAGAGLLARRVYVVRLTPEGYRVRFVRGVGVGRGRWVDVDDAVTARVGGARCLVLRRRDGRSTVIPVDVLEGSSEEFVREVGRRLGPRRDPDRRRPG